MRRLAGPEVIARTGIHALMFWAGKPGFAGVDPAQTDRPLRLEGVFAANTAKESRQSRGFYDHRGWMASRGEQTQHLGPTDVALHEIEYRKSLA